MGSSMKDGVALVTNAHTDIGIAVAQRLIDVGCTKLMLAGTSDMAMGHVREAISERAKGKDIRLETLVYQNETYNEVENVIAKTETLLGGLNYAVNCLSLLPVAPRRTAETEAGDFKQGLASSSREIWLFCKAQASYFISQHEKPAEEREQGRNRGHAIVNIVPFGNIGVNYSQGIQAASSYSAIGITKSLARDVKPYGIRINAVCPGSTNSKEDRAVVRNNDTESQHTKDALVHVEEVANAAVFLVGPDASGIIGVALPVDLGWCLTHG